MGKKQDFGQFFSKFTRIPKPKTPKPTDTENANAFTYP